MSIPKPYVHPSRASDAWFFAGNTTAYPNISDTSLSSLLPCKSEGLDALVPGCKVFDVPSTDTSQAVEVNLDDVKLNALADQVVVFQFQGSWHAVDHRCPHSSYPLSKGIPFEIEDFGIQLSTGLRCPKHDWSFDLVRGNGDRGSYKLKIWEVQLRPGEHHRSTSEESGGDTEVWVRRKQRMG